MRQVCQCGGIQQKADIIYKVQCILIAINFLVLLLQKFLMR